MLIQEPSRLYTGGKSAGCSEGERPDVVGNPKEPDTAEPIRGSMANVTVAPSPEEPA